MALKLRQPRVLAGAVALGAALTLVGLHADIPAMVWLFKPLTTGLILWVAWRRGLGGDRYARLVLAGLGLSLVGDLLLIERSLFLAGLVVFLLAQLCYLAAFTTGVGFFPRRQPFGAAAIVAGAVLLVVWPSLPTMLRAPVAAYGIAIALMVGQAHARAALAPLRENRRAAIGATLFLLSDALLAIDRFASPFAAAPVAILASYWAAQTLIALSIPHTELEPAPLRIRA